MKTLPYVQMNHGRNTFWIAFFILYSMFFIKGSCSLFKAKQAPSLDEYLSSSRLTSFKTSYIIDQKSQSCDVTVRERVAFVFTTPTNIVHHIVTSKKKTYYNFQVKLGDESQETAKIVKTEIYSQKPKGIFYNTEHKSIDVQETWIITATLDKNVVSAIFEFEYNIQRGLSIDVENQKNILNVDVINSYPQSLNLYNIDIELWNFLKIEPDKITLPEFSKLSLLSDVKENDSAKDENNKYEANQGYLISIQQKIESHSGINLNLPLPLEIKLCEAHIFTFFLYFLFGLAFILTTFTIGVITSIPNKSNI
jgi:hypothetical protein